MANFKENLTSYPLERQILASLLEYPDVFYEVEHFLSDRDFDHRFHSACFCIIKEAYTRKEKLDVVIVSQRLTNLGLTKFEEINSFDYVDSIKYNKLADKETAKTACVELSKLRKLRDLVDQSERTKKFVLDNRDKPLENICLEVDKLNNEMIRNIGFKDDSGVNIFATMKQNIEYDAEHPPQDFWQGPFKTVNRIFGSITIPSNITLIAARTGANKTNLALFYSLHLAINYGIPIIYCDFGELNIKAIQHRCLAMLCKGMVPYDKLVRGTWRQNPEWAKIVRDNWKKIENLTLLYYDVGSMHPKEIISLIRRAYYSRIGRDKMGLLVYDYLKPFDHDPKQSDWQLMSQFAKDLKTLINNEIPIPAWMSIQMNRLGITNNKKSNQVDDSENSMQVDRVLHNASLGFLLRMKTTDELQEEGNAFGGIKMIPVKHREILGDDYMSALKPVRLPDGSWRKNYINIDMRSFYFEDKGDLNQMVAKMNNQVNLTNNNDGSKDYHLHI